MPKVQRDDRLSVDDIMPTGEVHQLPEEWRQNLQQSDQWFESPSSISTFLECPTRWFMERHVGMPRERPGFHAVVGSFIHRVLEVFYSEPSHYRDFDLLSRVFRTAWDAIKQGTRTGIIPPGLQFEFNDLEDRDDDPDKMRGAFFKKAREAIDAVEDFDIEPSHLEIVANEKWVQHERNGITIRGKIDRMIKGKFGGVIIQDYKTGNNVPGEDEEVSFLHPAFVPLGLYAYMVSRGNRPDGMDARVVRSAQALYLPPKVKFNIKARQQNLQDVDELIDRVTSEMQHIAETGEIIVAPGSKPDQGACRFCKFHELCPAWNDTGEIETTMNEVVG